MLAEMNPKGILDGTMVLYTIVRLILIPAILFGLTALLPIPCITSGNYGYYCGDADTGDNCTAVCQISWE